MTNASSNISRSRQNQEFRVLYDNLFDQVIMQREVSEKEINGLIDLLDLRTNQLVLDQGCGTGSVSIPLAQKGYRVVGIDQMPDYIEQAEKKAQILDLNCQFYTSDFSGFKPDQSFDGVFSWWTSWGHGTDDENYQTIQSAYNCLKQDGRYTIDWMNVPHILANFKSTVKSESVTSKFGKVLMERRVDIKPTSNRDELTLGCINTLWTYTLETGEKISRSTQMRMYMPDHIRDMLAKVGFKQIKVLGDDGKPLNIDHRRVHLVASK